MYLQITNRCNMTCAHCCNSCTAEGQDMSLATFRKALQLCEDYSCIPFIGGGEPTLHPRFEQMLLEAMPLAAEQGSTLGIITNGSITRRALIIARLTKAGVISGELSQDQYHDPIELEVEDAFHDAGHCYGGGNRRTTIRDTSNGGRNECLPHGRGVELLGLKYHDPDFEGEDVRDWRDCPCTDWMVYPDGTIRQCGCENSPIVGHVDTGIDSPLSGECCHSPEWVNECIENDAGYLLHR